MRNMGGLSFILENSGTKKEEKCERPSKGYNKVNNAELCQDAVSFKCKMYKNIFKFNTESMLWPE